MASKFDVNRDLGVAKVDWSKVHLDDTKHPQKYPSEEESAKAQETVREFVSGFAEHLEQVKELETPIGPVPVAKFNPLTKAWELDQ